MILVFPITFCMCPKDHTFVSLILVFVISSICKYIVFRIPLNTIHGSPTRNVMYCFSGMNIGLSQRSKFCLCNVYLKDECFCLENCVNVFGRPCNFFFFIFVLITFLYSLVIILIFRFSLHDILFKLNSYKD